MTPRPSASTCGPTWSARTTPSPSSRRPPPTRCTPTCSSGPSGSGKRAAARAFAALLLAEGSKGEAAERHARLALAETHPDLHVIEPTTAQGRIDAAAAREIVQQAALSPAEGARKVLVLEDFHLIDKFGAILLKYVEEPPASTFFVILAEDVPPGARHDRVPLGPHRPRPGAAGQVVVDRLVAEGVTRPTRDRGRRGRRRGPRPGPAPRHRRAVRHAGEALAGMPARLDGTGTRAAELAAEVKALIDDAQAVIDARHADGGRASCRSASSATGSGGAGKKDLDDRHKREVRRHRTAELRFALATLRRRLPRRPRRPPAARTSWSPACTASTTPRWPSSASPTSRCCSSRCSRSSRRSPPKVSGPARIAQW